MAHTAGPVGSPASGWPRPDADHLLVDSATMAGLEEQLFASGLPVEALMEKAALAVSRRLLDLLRSDRAGPFPLNPGVIVLVGPGHNGGDGLVVARELHLAGVPVRLWCPFERLRPLTEAHRRHALWLGIPQLQEPPASDEPSLWVDALFGIGQNRPPGERLETLLSRRQQARPGGLVAIDVPTGICADSGRCLGAGAATACVTWTIGLIKKGLIQDMALAHVGQLERIDLGLPAALLASLGTAGPLALQAADAVTAPRPRPAPDAAKYSRGRLLVLAGSRQYRGAGHLALLGASASGCGSLRAALPPELAEQLWQVLPHVVLEASRRSSADGLSRLADLQDDWLERLDAVLIGPGLGSAPATPDEQQRWQELGRFAGLVVLDADGLNRLAAGAAGPPTVHWLQQRQGPTWLTPHAGEFARLFPQLADRPPLEAARAAASLTGAGLVLKGAHSVVAASDGRSWQLRASCPAAARAGLGDVLAGYAAGHGALAQAACGTADATHLAVAALDHALAGIAAAAHWGEAGATPMAVAAELGRRRSHIGEGKHTSNGWQQS